MKKKQEMSWFDEDFIFNIKPIKEYLCYDSPIKTGTYHITKIEFIENKLILSISLSYNDGGFYKEIIDIEIKSLEKLVGVLKQFQPDGYFDLIGSIGTFIIQAGEADSLENIHQYLEIDTDSSRYSYGSPIINMVELFPIFNN
ncbi:MAG: hypothetical protein ACRC1T_04690 [Clostridium chrysemydis]|uniref:hypothetical protein n=1 Tax=Clostridium chrysemydis TaxID=2665504 RepID=UPI003F378A52